MAEKLLTVRQVQSVGERDHSDGGGLMRFASLENYVPPEINAVARGAERPDRQGPSARTSTLRASAGSFSDDSGAGRLPAVSWGRSCPEADFWMGVQLPVPRAGDGASEPALQKLPYSWWFLPPVSQPLRSPWKSG